VVSITKAGKRLEVYFGEGYRLKVLKSFYAETKDERDLIIPKGTRGKVIEGQNLYGYTTVEFGLGRKRHRERTVVTDYSCYAEDVDYDYPRL
jgi:hypothetical protein